MGFIYNKKKNLYIKVRGSNREKQSIEQRAKRPVTPQICVKWELGILCHLCGMYLVESGDILIICEWAKEVRRQIKRVIRRLRRRVAPGTVEAVSRPVAHALTRLSTGPNPRTDRAVAQCVPSAGPSRRTGRQSGTTTPRVARSGAPHCKRAVDAAEAPPRAAVTEPASPESARAPASGHRPAAAAAGLAIQ
ncbi:hypothetical protein E3N88_05163 [Mikania micrantha]|uniref:Uncharacterized protein n=1 Tax=Mikania micrantha TaxID=192012 RepID=A0A5N6PWI8_9ASTR|nr:hypothetical protein E3N88_05163 [Mikania micrantha]